jgi:hypothetical protein
MIEKKAIEGTTNENEKRDCDKYRERLKLFEQKKPYHELPQKGLTPLDTAMSHWIEGIQHGLVFSRPWDQRSNKLSWSQTGPIV